MLTLNNYALYRLKDTALHIHDLVHDLVHVFDLGTRTSCDIIPHFNYVVHIFLQSFYTFYLVVKLAML